MLLGILLAFLVFEAIVRILVPPPAALPTFDRSAAFYLSDRQSSRDRGEAATDPLRIAVIGDSFTKGVGVQTYDRYADRMEWLFNLNRNTRPVRIRVFDKAGTSTFQQISMLEQALDWEAELVILGVVLNDTEDHTRPREVARHRAGTYSSPPPPWLTSWRTGSLFYSRWSAGRSRTGFTEYYRWLVDEEYSGWKRFTKAVSAMKRMCDLQGVTLVAVIFPLMSHDLRPGRYAFTENHERMAKPFSDEGIPVVDLLEPFTGMSPARMQAIPAVDPHPSEIAHRISAEAVFDALLSRSLVSKEYRPRLRKEHTLPKIWKQNWERIHGAVKPAP
jgi:lysophospholipase L1-like esterase